MMIGSHPHTRSARICKTQVHSISRYYSVYWSTGAIDPYRLAGLKRLATFFYNEKEKDIGKRMGNRSEASFSLVSWPKSYFLDEQTSILLKHILMSGCVLLFADIYWRPFMYNDVNDRLWHESNRKFSFFSSHHFRSIQRKVMSPTRNNTVCEVKRDKLHVYLQS